MTIIKEKEKEEKTKEKKGRKEPLRSEPATWSFIKQTLYRLSYPDIMIRIHIQNI